MRNPGPSDLWLALIDVDFKVADEKTFLRFAKWLSLEPGDCANNLIK